jgi:hypothetical protein
MHKQPVYLYKNIHSVYADLTPISTMGYRKVYARPIKLYKGIDNEFSLRLLNGDEKRIDAVGQTLHWLLMDRDTAELKFATQKVVEGSDNSTITLEVTEGEMEPLKSGYYMYSAYLVDSNNKKTILYCDSMFNASVMVEVVENSFPQVYPSIEVTSDEYITADNVDYVEIDDSLYTSALDSRPDMNSKNTALHTVAFYCNNYNGTVEIQATLENGQTDITQWAVIDTVNISDTDVLVYQNFNGIYSLVRFRMIPNTGNTGTVDKILYRS